MERSSCGVDLHAGVYGYGRSRSGTLALGDSIGALASVNTGGSRSIGHRITAAHGNQRLME